MSEYQLIISPIVENNFTLHVSFLSTQSSFFKRQNMLVVIRIQKIVIIVQHTKTLSQRKYRSFQKRK